MIMKMTHCHFNVPTEQQEQTLFVSWVRLQYPKSLIFAIPNGGKKSILEAVAFKRTGTVAGVPDLIFLHDNRTIFIEMKRQKKGVISKVQKTIIAQIEDLGHIVIIAYGATDGMNKIKKELQNIT